MSTVFLGNAEPTASRLRKWSEISRHEFYDGSFPADLQLKDFSYRKIISDPVFVTEIEAGSGITYSRSWKDIRQGQDKFLVIWFVRKGELEIAQDHILRSIGPEQYVILDSARPFRASIICDNMGAYQSYQIRIPFHLLIGKIDPIAYTERTYDYNSEAGAVLREVLLCMVSVGSRSQILVTAALFEAFRTALIGAIAAQGTSTALSRRAERRFLDIKRHIANNIGNPNLTLIDTAKKLRISPRYVSHILKQMDIRFVDILWGGRLELARELLADRRMASTPIGEIAAAAGFKAASHFSRAFKRAYGCNPRHYRLCAEDMHSQYSEPPVGEGGPSRGGAGGSQRNRAS